MSETEDLVLYDSFILMATFQGKLEINRLFDILKKLWVLLIHYLEYFFFILRMSIVCICRTIREKGLFKTVFYPIDSVIASSIRNRSIRSN